MGAPDFPVNDQMSLMSTCMMFGWTMTIYRAGIVPVLNMFTCVECLQGGQKLREHAVSSAKKKTTVIVKLYTLAMHPTTGRQLLTQINSCFGRFRSWDILSYSVSLNRYNWVQLISNSTVRLPIHSSHPDCLPAESRNALFVSGKAFHFFLHPPVVTCSIWSGDRPGSGHVC